MPVMTGDCMDNLFMLASSANLGDEGGVLCTAKPCGSVFNLQGIITIACSGCILIDHLSYFTYSIVHSGDQSTIQLYAFEVHIEIILLLFQIN